MSQYDSSRADPRLRTLGSFRRYLQTVLMQRFPETTMGVRTSRELKTLATILDHLAEGNLAAVGDVAVQRWKALESSIGDKSWSLAQHQELIPSQEVGLSGDWERTLMARAELARVELDEASQRVHKKPTAANSGSTSGG